MPRRTFEFDTDVVYQILAEGGTAEDIAARYGCKVSTLTARRYRDSALDSAFTRGLEARKTWKESERVADESEDGLSWDDIGHDRMEREARFEARLAADRRLVSEALGRAGRPLCRKELDEETLLGYDRINDALDWLRLHWMVREVSTHWFIERYELAEAKTSGAPVPFQMREHNSDLFAW